MRNVPRLMHGRVVMAEIALAAFNARYAHCSFSARYLLANLGELQDRAGLLEFDLSVSPRIAAEKILSHNPQIVSLGCYIWNIDLVTRVAALLKTLRPDIHLVLGGPEISYETETQEIFQYADHIICGEGEIEFPSLCRKIIKHKDTKTAKLEADELRDSSSPSCLGVNLIHAEPVDLTQIELPYAKLISDWPSI